MHIDYMIKNIMLFNLTLSFFVKFVTSSFFFTHFAIVIFVENKFTHGNPTWPQKWSRSLSTLESDIQNDYVSEEKEEEDNDNGVRWSIFE